jgi:uncharacterized protein YjbJ (UPF0337 family)
MSSLGAEWPVMVVEPAGTNKPRSLSETSITMIAPRQWPETTTEPAKGSIARRLQDFKRNNDLRQPLTTHEPEMRRTFAMDWDRVEGNWKQFKGKFKEKWGKLTDDDLDVIQGNRDQLEGKLQERYGTAKDQVRKDVDSCLDRA